MDDNAIQINDPSVSVHLAEFFKSGSDYVLKDLGSTNGIRVNGKHASEAKLCPGDRVRFGSVEGVFEPDVKGPAQPLPPQEAPLPVSVGQSRRPSDFGNASPFTRKAAKTDPVKTAALVTGGVAIAAFLGAVLYALLSLKIPTF